MKGNYFFPYLFCLLILTACGAKKSPLKDNKDTLTVIQNNNDSIATFNADSLEKLLNAAIRCDTMERWPIPQENFYFFKSGNILSNKEKNAIFFQSSSDSTNKLELYTIGDSSWTKMSEVDGLDCLLAFFNVTFDDYNFDGQKDMYIQRIASGGYALSRGHLITIDKSTKKMLLHPETRDFANMKPNPKTKTITSERRVVCKTQGTMVSCKQNNKWKGNQLIPISEECPCIYTEEADTLDIPFILNEE